MADYRDPKVTTTGARRESSTGKWIGIAVAVIAALLLLAWLLGMFDGGTDVEPVTETPATEGTAVAPATEGTAPATEGTAPATEGTAPATEGTAPAQQ